MRYILLRGAHFILFGIITLHLPLYTQWSVNPGANTPVCTASQDQNLYGTMSDGAGGVIITWTDTRSLTREIYAQRLNEAGFKQWPPDGVLISSAASDQYDPLAASDGNYGAIVTWVRSGASEDIYAQRVDQAGLTRWTVNGIIISSAAGNQLNPVIVGDGAGGAVIAWMDRRNGSNYDIYAQRVDSAGNVLWTPGGLPVFAGSGNQRNPAIVSDEEGGAIIAWECDSASGLGFNIFAQRVSDSGLLTWGPVGVQVSMAAGDQLYPCIVADDSNGAVIAWNDYRSGSHWDIYAQRISNSGSVMWSANGVPVAALSGDQESAVIARDGSGGAIIGWADYRSAANWDIYVQRVDEAGSVRWATDGVGVATAGNDQVYPEISDDNGGGAVVCWVDRRGGRWDSDVYAQRVDANGSTYWTPDGIAVSENSDDQYNVRSASDGGGGAIIVIEQIPSDDFCDIYAQRVMGSGAFPMGSVSGLKFHDANNNGSRDEGESGLSSWKICLSGTLNDSAVTNTEGIYLFDSLVPGSYAIREEIRTGWTCTSPPADTFSFFLNVNENRPDNNFGNNASASLSGVVWNDVDADGTRDPADTLLPGWLVSVRSEFGGMEDTVLTDPSGSYSIPFLDNGTYIVALVGLGDWIQTFPPGLGSYIVQISGGASVVGKDFGAVFGYKYIGPGSGNWSDSSNWTGNRPPGYYDNVLIPDGSEVTVDSLPADSIRSLRIEGGGELSFSPAAGRLKIAGKLRIDSGGVLGFPPFPVLSGLICHNDWVNRGSFIPGQSTITFTGELPKVVAGDPGSANSFYRLEIGGAQTRTEGNIAVQNMLILHGDILLRDIDTVTVGIDDTSAIQDNGTIVNGTVKRDIAGGATGRYRFESPSTYVKFNGSGFNPSALSITTLSQAAGGNFMWEFVGGIVDTVSNVITVDSVRKFSKWPFGIPRPTKTEMEAAGDPEKIEFIERLYYIEGEGGDGYEAEMSLRYDQSGVPPSIEESDLKLWRGPFLGESVRTGWNLVAMSLFPEDCGKDAVFPGAISSAFAYEGMYVERDILRFGEGYWLKYPGEAGITIEGKDIARSIVHVGEGWNLIGAISYPVASGSVVTFPPGIIGSMFFGYRDGYRVEDTLKPLNGYWVKINQSGELMLTNIGGSGEMSHSKLFPDRFDKLSFKDAAGNEGVLYFGAGRNIDLNRFELPPVPPAGAFDVRFETGTILETNRKGTTTERRVIINSPVYPVDLKWEILGSPQTPAAKLKAGGKEYTLSANGTTAIADSTISLSLILPSPDGAGIPDEYGLSQNYPNPFNPATIIEYALPVDSRVVIKVYDILGRAVATIADEEQSAGYKSVEWKAGEYAGGVYFCKLYARGRDERENNFICVKKMLLIK